ncbi:transglutaminase-like domain-containing protein [Clostridium sp. DL1XJH146]
MKNPVDIGLILIILFPIIKGFMTSYSSKNLKEDAEHFSSNIAFIISIFVGSYFTKKIFIERDLLIYEKIYNYIPFNIINFIEARPITLYIIVMPIMIFLSYFIINGLLKVINSISLFLILDGIEKFLKKRSDASKKIVGAIFRIPMAIGLLIIVVVALNIGSYFEISDGYQEALEKSIIFSKVNAEILTPISKSNFAQNIPNIINNSFKIEIKYDQSEDGKSASTNTRTIVYYNGITLEDGISSNEEINAFSRELVVDKATVKEKAQVIYEWVGANIEYDYSKAEKILRSDYSVESGSINTYYTREGICFDYSCLFATMCIANDIQVRIITGEGKSNDGWVGHAWNQVYDPVEEKWINVDATFYVGGNYFDSPIFNLDHRESEIAGEW